MARNIFLAYDREDAPSANLFGEQVTKKNKALAFVERHVAESFDHDDAPIFRIEITKLIETVSATICLIGKDTSKSRWVNWEINKSADLGKKVVGVRLHTDDDQVPLALKDRKAKILAFADVDAILKALGS